MSCLPQCYKICWVSMFSISYLILFVVTSNDFKMDLSAVVLPDSQGKYFEQYLEEHNICIERDDSLSV